MGRFDSCLFDCGFAIGSTSYEDHYPGDEEQNRIVLSVAPENNKEATTEMIVDTGAPWCILHPELNETWGLKSESHDPGVPLRIRGQKWFGHLIRANMALLAINGKDLLIEATFFVPLIQPGNTWNYPNFIGLDGFLNRILFAVDPSEKVFYFGAL